MHFSAHGNTAPEVIYGRADAAEPFMGLTSWRGELPSKSDAEIAKNYLNGEEIDLLNRIVNLYLDFAELQAKSRTPMYMEDWINKLDEFLKISGRGVLTNAGLVSHRQAIEKANSEYEKYAKRIHDELSPVEKHFLEAMTHAKKLEKKQKGKK
jgi:hypothetical protein